MSADPDPYTIRPPRHLNGDSGADIRMRVEDLLSGEPRDVVIDCSGVEFMDSSGFGCLMAALKLARAHRVALELRHINSQIRTLLELTGTEALFETRPED
ncbi:anti-sigma factor antagonist [Synechococcus sp. RSCCF101]|uniref:STAS domain-containing protein n=1 Tax=Synechococcus sp. RSCCF101 TaxID=2511069 RepID=UPI001246D740|nr:STAS domain-containing protein [Synechococcus sp. RSCCF101]QEY31058.1 anti-sigma factor antagonist [Synechococcus sp. RSCCF101]